MSADDPIRDVLEQQQQQCAKALEELAKIRAEFAVVMALLAGIDVKLTVALWAGGLLAASMAGGVIVSAISHLWK